MPVVEIITDRLCINELCLQDASVLYEYRSHKDVSLFQGWIPLNIDESQNFIIRNASTLFNQNDSWFQLAIRLRDTNQLVGDIGLHFIDSYQVEIGFTIAPDHQCKGFGSEAVIAVLSMLFNHLNKHRVFASVDPCNQASMNLLKKIGMRQEAHFRKSLFWRGEWVDDVVFAVLRSEWNEKQVI